MRQSTLRWTLLAILPGIGCSGQAPLRLPFQGLSSHSVHRFFPDLEERENAIRYGRWRALESAWTGGISADLDRRLEDSLLVAIHRLPSFPPDPTLCAPRFSREATRSFSAVLEADALEREVADALASTDASAAGTKTRIERSLAQYHRSRFALSEPDTASGDTSLGDLRTAKLLLEGDWLFAQSAEDLEVSSFREQRWKVKASVDRYDQEIESPPDSIEASWYARYAAALSQAHPLVTAALDRATRFRIDVFRALAPRDPASRRERLEAVERAYGLR